jgi:amino acid adenylation domain-containing protein
MVVVAVGQDTAPATAVVPLLARIAQHVNNSPDSLAVVAGEQSLTYRELWGRSLALADELRALGCGSDTAVALCADRSVDLVVGALGIVAASAGYIALDPTAPADRLQQMIDNSGSPVLVASGEAAAALRASTVLAIPTRAVAGGTVAEAAPTDLAYVVYTSGSTGVPKGVMVEHAGLANLVDWHLCAFAVTSADHVTQIASPGFDASVWEIWPCLVAGATLHIVPDALKTDPGALRDWLVDQDITVTFLPTPLAEAVVRLDWPRTAALRILLTGGDALHRRPRSELPFTLVNNYGLSEASVVSTSGPVDPEASDSTPDIGAAIDGVDLRVVDPDDRPVPDGESGELLVAGVSVARGYIGSPELTTARFFTDPIGMRVYRTGDLVRRHKGGTVEYLGRIDDQLQIRGFRVEPGEIVSLLDQHPAVSASAVIAAGDPPDQRLIGFVVPASETTTPGSADLGDVRTHLAQRLPAHMIPADLVIVAELPVTANGKVDRAALLGQLGPTEDRDELTAPATELEGVIAEIVAERLGMPQVGTDENFFLLGGHSMLGAQLVIRINERFGIEMSLRALFEGPTVIEMATEVERQLVCEIDAMSDESVLHATTALDDS